MNIRTAEGLCLWDVEVSVLLYSTVLYCTVLYCTVLYYTVLYCTILYCTVEGLCLWDVEVHVLYCVVLRILYILLLRACVCGM